MLAYTAPPRPHSGGLIGPLITDPHTWWRHLTGPAAGAAHTYGLAVIVPVLALVLVGVVARRALHARQQRRLQHGARLVEIHTPPEVGPDSAQRFWGTLVGLLRPTWRRLLDGQPHLAWQYACDHTGVTISIWVPGALPPGLVERAVEAAWPAARTRTVHPAPPPVPADAVVTGGSLRLHGPDVLPIRTDVADDALRALLGAAAGLGETEHAVVQILARPVTGSRARAGLRAVRLLRAGKPLRSRTAGGLSGLVSLLLDIVTLHPGRQTTTTGGYDPARADQARAVLGKATGPQYEVVVRYATAAGHRSAPLPQRRAARQMARGRAHGIAAVFALHSGHNGFTRRHLHHPATALAARRLRRGDLMSVPELASLARLPADVLVPGLSRAGAKSVPPPPGIPDTETSPDAVVIGDRDAGPRRPVSIPLASLLHHLHILGATGSGKSTLIAMLVLADAAAGRGAIVVEPRGDLTRDILHRLPHHTPLIRLDPDLPDDQLPVINPLDLGDTPSTAAEERAVDNIIATFHRIYAAYWGPRTEEILTACCHTLLGDRRRTGRVPSLADIPRLLTEPTVRDQYTAQLGSRELRAFWRWCRELSDTARAQAIGPVLNKLNAFLLKRFVRATITGSSTVDMAAVLDGGILLARLPKGTLGEDGSRLLGSLIVATAWQAATARAAQPEHQRRHASLYLDEAHNYLTLPYRIEDLLAEARGYRLALILAHQNLDQLPAELRHGLAANARNKMFFACSPHDARELAHQTTPTLTAHDLANLGEYVAATRLIIGHGQTSAFTLTTRPLPPLRHHTPPAPHIAAPHTPATMPTTHSSRRPQRVPGDPRTAPTTPDANAAPDRPGHAPGSAHDTGPAVSAPDDTDSLHDAQGPDEPPDAEVRQRRARSEAATAAAVFLDDDQTHPGPPRNAA